MIVIPFDTVAGEYKEFHEFGHPQTVVGVFPTAVVQLGPILVLVLGN